MDHGGLVESGAPLWLFSVYFLLFHIGVASGDFLWGPLGVLGIGVGFRVWVLVPGRGLLRRLNVGSGVGRWFGVPSGLRRQTPDRAHRNGHAQRLTSANPRSISRVCLAYWGCFWFRPLGSPYGFCGSVLVPCLGVGSEVGSFLGCLVSVLRLGGGMSFRLAFADRLPGGAIETVTPYSEPAPNHRGIIRACVDSGVGYSSRGWLSVLALVDGPVLRLALHLHDHRGSGKQERQTLGTNARTKRNQYSARKIRLSQY